jgi:hypothetical protein
MMTLNREVARSMRQASPIPKSALGALAGIAVLYMAARRHTGSVSAFTYVVIVILVPTLYTVSRRLMRAVRQRETERRIMRNTLAYFRSQQCAPFHSPAAWPPQEGTEPGPASSGDPLLLAGSPAALAAFE